MMVRLRFGAQFVGSRRLLTRTACLLEWTARSNATICTETINLSFTIPFAVLSVGLAVFTVPVSKWPGAAVTFVGRPSQKALVFLPQADRFREISQDQSSSTNAVGNSHCSLEKPKCHPIWSFNERKNGIVSLHQLISALRWRPFGKHFPDFTRLLPKI
jgi:hypothetical protein